MWSWFCPLCGHVLHVAMYHGVIIRLWICLLWVRPQQHPHSDTNVHLVSYKVVPDRRVLHKMIWTKLNISTCGFIGVIPPAEKKAVKTIPPHPTGSGHDVKTGTTYPQCYQLHWADTRPHLLLIHLHRNRKQ